MKFSIQLPIWFYRWVYTTHRFLNRMSMSIAIGIVAATIICTTVFEFEGIALFPFVFIFLIRTLYTGRIFGPHNVADCLNRIDAFFHESWKQNLPTGTACQKHIDIISEICDLRNPDRNPIIVRHAKNILTWATISSMEERTFLNLIATTNGLATILITLYKEVSLGRIQRDDIAYFAKVVHQ